MYRYRVRDAPVTSSLLRWYEHGLPAASAEPAVRWVQSERCRSVDWPYHTRDYSICSPVIYSSIRSLNLISPLLNYRDYDPVNR